MVVETRWEVRGEAARARYKKEGGGGENSGIWGVGKANSEGQRYGLSLRVEAVCIAVCVSFQLVYSPGPVIIVFCCGDSPFAWASIPHVRLKSIYTKTEQQEKRTDDQ